MNRSAKPMEVTVSAKAEGSEAERADIPVGDTRCATTRLSAGRGRPWRPALEPVTVITHKLTTSRLSKPHTRTAPSFEILW